MTAAPQPTDAEARMLDLSRQSVAAMDRILDAANPAPSPADAATPVFLLRFIRLRQPKLGEFFTPLWEAVPVAYPTLADALTGAADHCRLNLSPHATLTLYPLADGTGAMIEAAVPNWPAPLAVYKVEPSFVVRPPAAGVAA